MEIKTDSRNAFNLTQSLAWMIIVVCFSEWGSFIIGYLINFGTFKNIPVYIFIFMGSMIFSPFFTGAIRIIAKNHLEKIKQCLLLLVPIVLIIVAIIGYINYLSLTHLISIEVTPNIFLDEPVSLPIIGFVMEYYPVTLGLLLLQNAIIFWILIPFAFILTTSHEIEIHYTRETNFGILFAALYFLFRYGSGIGILLRLSLLFIAIVIIWIIGLKSPTFKRINVQTQYHLTPAQIPKGIGVGFITIGAFLLGVANYSMNVMLANSWVYIFLVASLCLNEYLAYKRILLTNSWIQIILALLFGISTILIVGCQFTAILLKVFPILMAIGLFTLGFMIRLFSESFSQESNEKFRVHPFRQIVWWVFGMLGFALPYLMVVADPFSSIITLALLSILEFRILRQVIKIQNLKHQNVNEKNLEIVIMNRKNNIN